MRLLLTGSVCTVVLSASPIAAPSAAAEPSTRVFGAASAAVMGGIVAGPIGLVAGAVIGYALSPTLTDGVSRPRRVARRRVRRAPVVAQSLPPAPAAYAQQQAYVQQPAYPYPQPGYPQQPMYLAQPVPAPQAAAPYATAQMMPAQQPPMPTQPTYGQAPAAMQRPNTYATVPMPGMVGPGGNYSAYAYKPQDGSQAPDPLH